MMKRAVLCGVLGCALFASAATLAANRQQLVATVGPGSTISIRTTSGVRVSTLKSGTYNILVRDRSRSHSFRLAGPAGSVYRASGRAFVGVTTWKVTLFPGAYRFWCERHPRTMRGTFRIR